MLLIKNDQIDAFKSEALKKFEDEMVEHVKAYFPMQYMAMEEKNIRATIQYGYLKAKTYGFITIRNVCLYLNNMMLLGSNFDNDPQYPWAKEILADENEKDSKTKIDKLSDKALKFIAKVTGSDNSYIYRCILNFTRNTDEIFKKLVESNLSDTLNHFRILFKQKYEVLEEVDMTKMINRGVMHANSYGIRSEGNTVVYLIFMFMMGSGFDKDPQLAWAGEILNDSTLNEDKKVERLYYTAVSKLKDVLSQYKS